MSFHRILIVGSGNVAWHFSKMFASLTPCEVWNYARNAKALDEFNLENQDRRITQLTALPDNIDLTILAVNDDNIGRVSEYHAWPGLVVHTSGTASIGVLRQTRSGVLWTLQSLKKNLSTDYRQIPFFIQTKNEADSISLKNLLETISASVYTIDDEQRLKVHLSAVLANNFTNHLYQIAHEVLKETSVPFDVLLPIIEEETRKIKLHNPFEIQTGPARRGDLSTIEKHEQLLSSDPDTLAIYHSMTQRILKKYGHDKL